MWPWADLGTLDESALRARGLRIRLADLWTPGRGGLAQAVVGLGRGCTASFVSPDGLLLTNHHCAHRVIQRNSRPGRDLLATGFLARTREQELRGWGARVYVFQNQTDVTRRVLAGLTAKDDVARIRQVEAREKQIVAECERTPHTRCHVARENDGLRFLLLENRVLQDVRLVAAPPNDLGNFGGEVDNFRWPRHSLDFTLLRAYVAPDGTPRAYHPDNVPYRPKRHLRLAPRGVRPGDFVMVLGTPARTNRYATPTELAWNARWYFPFRERLFAEWIAVLERTIRRHPAARLPTASRLRSLANALTHARGTRYGFRTRPLVAARRAEAGAYRRWLASRPERTARWGRALADLEAWERADQATRERDLLLRYLFWGVTLARSMQVIATWAQEQRRPEAARRPGFGRRDRPRLERELEFAQRSFHPATDKAAFVYLLGRLQALPRALRVRALDRAVGGRSDPAALRAFVERLYRGTRLTSARGRLRAFGLSLDALARSRDPGLRLAARLAPELDAWHRRQQARQGARLRLRRPYLASLIAFRGRRFYPDANRTPRVSFAHVAGYAPRDGVWHRPFTHLGGLLAKATGKPPFRVPRAARAALSSRYTALPACFLSNADTSGGNSGSPALDGRGRLVGLNFDRVFENVSGDFAYSPKTSRNILVDLRYILWYLAQVARADALLRELGVRVRPGLRP